MNYTEIKNYLEENGMTEESELLQDALALTSQEIPYEMLGTRDALLKMADDFDILGDNLLKLAEFIDRRFLKPVN
ncbi:MAG TPA: hypothetical protein PLI62_12325 [Spirochaetota bacterium]|nr:hypothetical protein [Spirochaetota bacterium]